MYNNRGCKEGVFGLKTAMKLLAEGKKIKPVGWEDRNYLYINNREEFVADDGIPFDLGILKDRLFVIAGTKKWKWVYNDGIDNQWFESEGYYGSIERIKEQVGNNNGIYIKVEEKYIIE